MRRGLTVQLSGCPKLLTAKAEPVICMAHVRQAMWLLLVQTRKGRLVGSWHTIQVAFAESSSKAILTSVFAILSLPSASVLAILLPGKPRFLTDICVTSVIRL